MQIVSTVLAHYKVCRQQATDTLLQGQRLVQSIRAQVQHQREG
jgi:hypothetical protein